MKHWYALFVKTGKEDIICQSIKTIDEYDCVKTLVPKRVIYEKKAGKVNRVVRNLYPGYVLINSNEKMPLYYEIKKIQDVYSWLENSGSLSKIHDDEINILLDLIGDSDVIEASTAIKVNSVVTIVSGPLMNNQGIIQRIDKHKNRARVSLNICGTEHVVDLAVNMLMYEDGTHIC